MLISKGTRDGSGDHGIERFYNVDDEFISLGVGEVFELDPRPTFALKSDSDFDTAFIPVFLNVALRSDRQLTNAIPFKPKSHAPPSLPSERDPCGRSTQSGPLLSVVLAPENSPSVLNIAGRRRMSRISCTVQLVQDPRKNCGRSTAD